MKTIIVLVNIIMLVFFTAGCSSQEENKQKRTNQTQKRNGNGYKTKYTKSTRDS